MWVAELATFAVIIIVGVIGLRHARERASMRTRRKYEHHQRDAGASQRA
jgi:hypothetical protein